MPGRKVPALLMRISMVFVCCKMKWAKAVMSSFWLTSQGRMWMVRLGESCLSSLAALESSSGQRAQRKRVCGSLSFANVCAMESPKPLEAPVMMMVMMESGYFGVKLGVWVGGGGLWRSVVRF